MFSKEINLSGLSFRTTGPTSRRVGLHSVLVTLDKLMVSVFCRRCVPIRELYIGV